MPNALDWPGRLVVEYNRADFQLRHPPIQLVPDGLRIIECDDNHLLVAIENAEFKLEVTGFDERRDLYVSASR